MNAKDWPLCVPKRDWQEVRSLADGIPIFAEDLVNHYRRSWDLLSEDAHGVQASGREWYLHRETALHAFARYEAGLMLKHFSKDGLITGADYCEARLQEVIFGWGWREAMSCAPTKWQKFISWRKKTAAGFAQKFQLWISRSNSGKLACHSPVPHIRLYALLYDRAAIPLEFCSDDYSAHLMTVCARQKGLIGENELFDRENVRRWRRDLGLKPSKHVVAKFLHPRKAKSLSLPIRERGGVIDNGIEGDYAVEIDRIAAKEIGLPNDYQAVLTPVGQWRSRH